MPLLSLKMCILNSTKPLALGHPLALSGEHQHLAQFPDQFLKVLVTAQRPIGVAVWLTFNTHNLSLNHQIPMINVTPSAPHQHRG